MGMFLELKYLGKWMVHMKFSFRNANRLLTFLVLTLLLVSCSGEMKGSTASSSQSSSQSQKDPTLPTTTTTTRMTTTTTLAPTTTTTTRMTTTTTLAPTTTTTTRMTTTTTLAPTTTTTTRMTTTTTLAPTTTTTTRMTTTTTLAPTTTTTTLISTPAASNSNPVTQAVVGSRTTYNVGPNQTYLEPDTIPWGALQAGDVVNIYYRATPYKYKICLRGQGTQINPIIINGVTDSSGNRPKFDFKDARTSAGCNAGGTNNVFNTSSQYSLEDYGGIVIKPGTSDPAGYKPRWIQIKNLEFGGAAAGNQFTGLTGATMTYGDSGGIWLQPSADILIENNIIYDNAFGIFTMAKDSVLESACERIIIRNNRIYGNGRVNNYYDHNLYIQATNPIIEGNFIGQVRSGSSGASYKSRSSGEIFRYNYVVSSSRAVDWVQSEDQESGIAAQPDYGIDYAYGNIIVNDCDLGSCATNPIHYGGDNLGEQENVSSVYDPGAKYRSRLYFYNNTVINKVKMSQSYRTHIFDLSLVGTTVEAWNNIFYLQGDSLFSWLEIAGKLNLRGNNIISGTIGIGDINATHPANFSVVSSSGLTIANPNFVNATSNNYNLSAGSPALNQGTGIPSGISPNTSYMNIPVTRQPYLQLNGLSTRSINGSALDLGAVEGP